MFRGEDERGGAVVFPFMWLIAVVTCYSLFALWWSIGLASAKIAQYNCVRVTAEAVVIASNRESLRTDITSVSDNLMDVAEETYANTLCGLGAFRLSPNWSIDSIQSFDQGSYTITVSQDYISPVWRAMLPDVELTYTKTAKKYQYQ